MKEKKQIIIELGDDPSLKNLEDSMDKHECTIGIWGDYEDTRTITFRELKKEADNNIEMLEYCKGTGYSYSTPYSLSDYLDNRKSTNLEKFKFCPYCGKEIDWKKLRSEYGKNTRNIGEYIIWNGFQ